MHIVLSRESFKKLSLKSECGDLVIATQTFFLPALLNLPQSQAHKGIYYAPIFDYPNYPLKIYQHLVRFGGDSCKLIKSAAYHAEFADEEVVYQETRLMT